MGESQLTVDFAGIPFSATALDRAVETFLARATSAMPEAWRFVNAHSVATAHSRADYLALLAAPGVNVPDGHSVAVVLDRLSPEMSVEQVRGPSFFESCLDRGRGRGARHYFLGGSPETLERMVTRARQRWPGVEIVGAWSPPFRELSSDEKREQDARIVGSGANIVWVGLGSPKQDFEAQRLAAEARIMAAGVGAAFDFLAGSKPQAPPWLGRIGMEWLFRLVTEPRRLWRRYLFGNSRFLLLAFQEWIGSDAHRRRS